MDRPVQEELPSEMSVRETVSHETDEIAQKGGLEKQNLGIILCLYTLRNDLIKKKNTRASVVQLKEASTTNDVFV